MKPKFFLALIFAIVLATLGVCSAPKTRQLKTQNDIPRCIPTPSNPSCPR